MDILYTKTVTANMPRRYRRNRRGRRYRRRKNRRKRNTATTMRVTESRVVSVPQIAWKGASTLLANKVKVRLRYGDNGYVLNPNAVNIVYHTFSCNSLHDPDVSGAGHQPRGYDQLMQLWNHYQVIGAIITCQFEQTANTQQVGIMLSDNATPATIQSDALEYSPNNSVHACTSTTEPTTLSLTYSQKKFFGDGALQEKFEGEVGNGARPAEQAYFSVYGMSSNPGVDPAAVYFKVIIDYIAVLTEPNLPAQS